jgi:hypothetical protein
MADRRSLRALERRVLRLVHDGIDDVEIARRFRRTPDYVGRVKAFTALPHTGTDPEPGRLRPLERRILKWRAAGADHATIGSRFRRSASHIQLIERLAAYRVARGDR